MRKALQEILSEIEVLTPPCDTNAIRGILRDIAATDSFGERGRTKEACVQIQIRTQGTKAGDGAIQESSAIDIFEGLEQYVQVDHEVYFKQGNSYRKASISKDVLVNHKTLSNFALRPVMRIGLPQGEVLRADVLTDTGTLHDIDFPRDGSELKEQARRKAP